MAELIKPIEIKQASQNSIELHRFYNFVILSQKNTEETNDVLCLEMSTIDTLIKHLIQIKNSQMN
jgi:hypothetical protein